VSLIRHRAEPVAVSVDDDWADEYISTLTRRHAAPTLFVRPVRPVPPGIGSPQDHAIHRGRISTRLIADGATERSERRSRVLPEPPAAGEPTMDEVWFGPWNG
jgi:hypothetical protein